MNTYPRFGKLGGSMRAFAAAPCSIAAKREFINSVCILMAVMIALVSAEISEAISSSNLTHIARIWLGSISTPNYQKVILA